MKKRVLLSILALYGITALRGAEPNRTLLSDFSFGVHTGIDIGAAVPWPPGKTIGGENKMRATPHLTPALGVSLTRVIDQTWSVSAEVTYKVVSLDAKAWVEDQQFRDRRQDPPLEVSFRGTAEMEMRFPMLEIPLYARYTFPGGNNRVLLGAYFARVFRAKMISTPYKGSLFPLKDDGTPDYSDPSPIFPSDTYSQHFSDDLSKWDVGFLAGYERQLFSRVTLSGRFSMGFCDIFMHGRKTLSYRMLHMRGTLTLGYTFGRK